MVVELLNTTTVGYGLVALGVVLFLIEASMPGFFLGVPATILVILGVYALVVPDLGIFTQWAPLIAVATGVPATLVTVWMYRRIAPPDQEPSSRTASKLVGLVGVVTAPVVPEAPRGKVMLQQETWSALSESGTIPVGAHVRVLRVEGILLVVTPVEPL